MSSLATRSLPRVRSACPCHNASPRLLHPSSHPIRPIFRLPSTPPHAFRTLTTSPRNRALRTVQEARARNISGPFSAKAAIVFLVAGAGLIFYFRREKERLERQRVAEQAKGVGRPKVGGAFNLIDQEGKEFSDGDMKGGFSIVGFFLSFRSSCRLSQQHRWWISRRKSTELYPLRL